MHEWLDTRDISRSNPYLCTAYGHRRIALAEKGKSFGLVLFWKDLSLARAIRDDSHPTPPLLWLRSSNDAPAPQIALHAAAAAAVSTAVHFHSCVTF